MAYGKSSVTTKYLFLLVLVVYGTFAARAASAQSTAGYWPFDDGVGAKATEVTGHARVAALANGAGWSSGEVGGAVSANSGLRQFVVIPAIDLSSTHAMTVAFWSKRTYSFAGGHALIESTADFTRSTTGFAVFPDDSTCAGIQIAMKGDVGETASCYAQPSSGVWHHFVLVLDKTESAGNQIVLYLDGVNQNPTRSVAASTNTNDFGVNPIWLFAQGGTGMFDSGQLDDLRIYKAALTPAEVQRIYRNTAVVSLSISPASVSIPPGTSQRFTATGIYADGSRRDITSWVTWSSVAPMVASMSHDGSTIGVGEGETAIKAAWGGLSASAHITVTAVQTVMNANTAQVTPGGVATVGVSLDTHGVQDNGSQASNQAAVSIGTPTAGDLITCEITFDGHNGNALVSLTDNNGGSYVPAVAVHLNATLIQWFGIYYKQAAVGSPTTVTLKTTGSQPWSAASCQSWKGVATSNALDSAFSQSQDALAANPTTGPNKTPSANGELIIAGLGLYYSGAPTAGTNYALIDSAPATQWWPEYWIQTNASPTAGNYFQTSENFTDMMAAFKPASTSSFTMAASPASLTVVQGNSGVSTVTTSVTGGFNSAITLSASGIPAGTTASFSQNPIPAPGSGSSTLTLAVGSSTAVGTYTITVTGTGGGLQHTSVVTLKVVAPGNFTLAASPTSLSVVQGSSGTSTIATTVSGGFNNSVSLSATGVPVGTTASFSQNPIPAPGSGNSTLTLAVGSSTAVGTYTITVTGSGGNLQHAATVTLKVVGPGNFTIAASPASLTVVQGSSGVSTVTTSVSGGFNGAITLSASGVPAGATASFSQNPIPAPGSGNSTLTLAVGSSTAVGTYTITVAGSGGNLQHAATVTLKVVAPGNFTIAASPASLTVVQGSSGMSTVTTSVSGGFNGAITLSASGLPAGATASFSQNPIPAPGSGNSTLTLAVGSSTAVGTYTITLTGSGGGLQKSTTVTLVVTATSDFAIAVSPTSLSVIRGNQGAATITTAISGGFNSAITLSASGVPSGTTVSFSPNPIPAPGSGGSIMTIAVGASTTTGTYSLIVTGTGGGLQRSTIVTLTVVAQVNLGWTASVSQVVGYNVYRSTQANGPYTKLNNALVTGITYIDQTAVSGMTYYYVATAVNAQGVESVYSNQATATVP